MEVTIAFGFALRVGRVVRPVVDAACNRLRILPRRTLNGGCAINAQLGLEFVG